MSYTPEPWDTRMLENRAHIYAGEGNGFTQVADADMSVLHPQAQCEANAARIVAAVNAVAGIPTEELTRLGLGGLAKIYAEGRG